MILFLGTLISLIRKNSNSNFFTAEHVPMNKKINVHPKNLTNNFYFFMKKKQLGKSDNNSQISNQKLAKCPSLCELSISEIMQFKNTQESLDFEQERDLITEMMKVDQFNNQYGLKNYKKRKQNKLSKFDEGSKFNRIGEIEVIEEHYEKEVGTKIEELCFDHDIKRKVTKKKDGNSAKQSHRRKRYYISEAEKTVKKNKQDEKQSFLQPHLFQPAVSPQPIAVQPNFRVKTRLEEPPLQQTCFQLEKPCPKLYHLLAQKFRNQIGDINTYLLTQSRQKEEFEEKKKSSALVFSVNSSKSTSNMKSSLQFSGTKQRKSVYFDSRENRRNAVENCYYHQINVQKPNAEEDLKRSSSVDAGLNKVHFIRIKQTQCSRDSSTGTQKTVKKLTINQEDQNSRCRVESSCVQYPRTVKFSPFTLKNNNY